MAKEKKLQELFESYFEPLCSYIVSKVGDIDSARDIVTDAFRDLYFEMQGVQEIRSDKLIELILKKSLERCVAILQNREDKVGSLDRTFHSIQNFERSVEEVMIEKEFHSLMLDLNPNFSKKQKEAFDLFFSGVETKLAAEIMGISESTFRSHKSYALKKFRIALYRSGWRCSI